MRAPVLIVVFVLLSALGMRLQPTLSESFHYDAIVHQQAAAEGVAANAWDGEEAYRLRRYHPPLISYVILANNAVFGDGAYAARVFAMISGALACVLVALSVVAFGRRPGGRFGLGHGTAAGAVFSSFLLVYLPVHLYISRSANWDAVYSALSIATLYALSLHLMQPSRRRLVTAAVLGALSFLTCELGLVLLAPFAAVWLLDRRSGGGRGGWWVQAAAAALLVLAVLWPAGVLKLDLLRTVRFRYYDSGFGEPNAPWVHFYATLWRQAPAYTIAAVAAIAALLSFVVRRRHAPADAPALAPLVPFAVYAAVVVLLSTRQRLVYIHHIADLFPALSVLIGAAFVLAFSRAARALPRTVLGLVAVGLVAWGVSSGTVDDAEVVGPQEHPGLASIGEFLEEHPGARTYFHYTAQMEYYAPGARVEGSPSRQWTADAIATAKVERYDFVVSDVSMFGDLIDGPEELERSLAPHYALARVVNHKRTGQPVAWIYRRSR